MEPLLSYSRVFAGASRYDEAGNAYPFHAPEGIRLVLTPAEKSEVVVIPDRPWERQQISHVTVRQDAGKYRMWYGARSGAPLLHSSCVMPKAKTVFAGTNRNSGYMSLKARRRTISVWSALMPFEVRYSSTRTPQEATATRSSAIARGGTTKRAMRFPIKKVLRNGRNWANRATTVTRCGRRCGWWVHTVR